MIVDINLNVRISSFKKSTLFNPANEVITYENDVNTSAFDMFAVGCIIAEMLLRRPLFAGTTITEHLKKTYLMRSAASLSERYVAFVVHLITTITHRT